MSMTKKDFLALADMIRKANSIRPEGNPRAFGEYAIGLLADFCKAQNPLFKRALWIDYIDGRAGPNGRKMGEDTPLRVRMLCNLRHAGHIAGWTKGKTYKAIWATNLPNWMGDKKIFLMPDSPHMGPELLVSLKDGECEIVG
jgi:hypothetical protein